jgi:hypothetical protein
VRVPLCGWPAAGPLDYNNSCPAAGFVSHSRPGELVVSREEEIREEARKVRRLQVVVGLVMNVLAQSDMPVEEAAALVAETRRFALLSFPDKGPTYDLIYAPRFRRLMAEKYGTI